MGADDLVTAAGCLAAFGAIAAAVFYGHRARIGDLTRKVDELRGMCDELQAHNTRLLLRLSEVSAEYRRNVVFRGPGGRFVNFNKLQEKQECQASEITPNQSGD